MQENPNGYRAPGSVADWSGVRVVGLSSEEEAGEGEDGVWTVGLGQTDWTRRIGPEEKKKA